MSKIQWTDETWNPVTGYTKVSAGCANCYAERDFPRVYGRQSVRLDHKGGVSVEPDPINVHVRARKFTDVRLHPDRLENPLHWRKPRRVFVNSMSDLFHEDVPVEFVARVFEVMRDASAHTFQVLTKRPERMREFLVGESGAGYNAKPIPNVWLGVSAEDQATADQRIPILLDTPAAVRFVSAEPLLGPIDFDCYPSTSCPTGWLDDEPGLDWIIVGGESGPKARPCDVAWIRSIIAQCKAAEVACFVKQVGAFPILDRCGYQIGDRKGGDPDEWPEDLCVREWPSPEATL